MQSVALIGGYFRAKKVKLSTRLLSPDVLDILQGLNPDCCLATGDNHGGILLTKMARMAGIPYIMDVTHPHVRFSNPRPPMSESYKKLLKSLLKGSHGQRTAINMSYKENADYYLARNKRLLDEADASIILTLPGSTLPDRVEGVAGQTAKYAEALDKPYFIGTMALNYTVSREPTIEVEKWEGWWPPSIVSLTPPEPTEEDDDAFFFTEDEGNQIPF
tara:strand:- start:1556 stop:2209 length:654 start_codon:yes stop_codon:yes gene_type:complete